MKRIFLAFAILFLMCAGAFSASETFDCFIGAKKVSEIECKTVDGVVWLPLAGIADALSLSQSAGRAEGEFLLANDVAKIRIVENSSVAWSGTRLFSLADLPRNIDGSLWIDEKSANSLFSSAARDTVWFRKAPGTKAPAPRVLPPSPSAPPPSKREAKNPTTTPSLSPPPRGGTAPEGGRGESALVVIDPGHGGQDPGAVGNGIREKDINLAIGLKLEAALKAKGVKVEMTRRTDVYLKLEERTAIANNLNADVFVSVHANALPKGKSATGFEIFIMALPTDRDALELAKFENRELVNGKINVEAADKNTQHFINTLSQEEKKKVSIILGDMKQNDKITRSTQLTESLFSMGNQSGLPMRRVAQAPFFVLRGTDNMAAVLLETGFITDAREAQLLVHPGYQQRIADAMTSGIITYIGGN